MNIFRTTIIMALLGIAQGSDPATYFGDTDNEAYIVWLNETSYDKTTFLPTKKGTGGVALHWTTDETHIYLAVAGKATGWMGFGIAESGSMLGADIVLFTAATNDLVDSHVLDQSIKPIPDDCQSWNLTNSVAKGGFLIFEASRLLNTNDLQDRVIYDDSNTLIPPTRLIAAWGDSSEPSYHGLDNFARGAVRFYGNSTDDLVAFAAAVKTEAEGNFTVGAKDFQIPANETTYQHFCVSEAELLAMGVPLNQSLHTIGIEPIVDERAHQYVHHFVVAGTDQPFDPATQSCEDEFPGIDTVYVWAPGDLPLLLPSDVGGPLGGSDYRAFRIEIHYNNPNLDTGVLDSSGVRFFYTSQKRKYDLGIILVGDPQVALINQSVAITDGMLAQHAFDCPDSCSTTFLTEPVTVIREHLHMHKAGVSITNEQVRDGKVLRQGTVQYWDFQQQGNLAVIQEPFELHSGDSFRTVCNYDPPNGEVFGLGSQDEMCMAFLFYYPRRRIEAAPGVTLPFMCGLGLEDTLPSCVATHGGVVADDSMIFRAFGSAPKTCPIGTAVLPSNIPPTINDTASSSLQNWQKSALSVISIFLTVGYLMS